MTARMQRTIAGPTTIEGVGLHTGEKGVMTFSPAAVGHGVRFVRVDLPGRPEVQVRPENAHFDPDAGRRTILQQDGVQIHTMEHVLSAVAGLRIDNLRIEVSSMEVPEGHDGSAAPIARALMAVGIVDQDKPVRHIKVTRPVRWSDGAVELSAVPQQGLRLTFTIEYDHPLIGVQTLSLDITPEVFLEQIAPARTFVLERDLEALRQAGWIKGGRIESAIVVGKNGILNDEPLRFPDESIQRGGADGLPFLGLLAWWMAGPVRAAMSEPSPPAHHPRDQGQRARHHLPRCRHRRRRVGRGARRGRGGAVRARVYSRPPLRFGLRHVAIWLQHERHGAPPSRRGAGAPGRPRLSGLRAHARRRPSWSRLRCTVRRWPSRTVSMITRSGSGASTDANPIPNLPIFVRSCSFVDRNRTSS